MGESKKSENVEAEDGQAVEVADPGQALQDQARIKDELAPNTSRSRPDLAPKGADKALEEVRQIRADNEARWATHNRTVIREEIGAWTTSGSTKTKGIEATTADGKLYLNTHGEAVLDQDGVIRLAQVIAKAQQAVS